MNFPRITTAVLLVGLMSGCASKSDAPGAADQAAKVDESEYVRVDSGLSSRIPRRIKRENLTRATVGGGSPTDQASGEGVRDALDTPMTAVPPAGANP